MMTTRKMIVLLIVAAWISRISAADTTEFQDPFAKQPRLDSEKQGYAIWGSRECLSLAGYDRGVGCKATGSLKMDAGKLSNGKKVTGFFVKYLPAEAGKKFNLMLKVRKKDLAENTVILARITLTGKNNSKKMSMRQCKLDPGSFEDGVWQRILLSADIPSSDKLTEEPGVNIWFGVQGMTRGTVWFDDVEFFEEEK